MSILDKTAHHDLHPVSETQHSCLQYSLHLTSSTYACFLFLHQLCSVYASPFPISLRHHLMTLSFVLRLHDISPVLPDLVATGCLHTSLPHFVKTCRITKCSANTDTRQSVNKIISFCAELKTQPLLVIHYYLYFEQYIGGKACCLQDQNRGTSFGLSYKLLIHS